MNKIDMIKAVRQKTGTTLKNAFAAVEAVNQSSVENAIEYLKNHNIHPVYHQKASIVKAYCHNDRIATILRISCFTDFTARCPVFQELTNNLLLQITSMEPRNVEDLLSQKYIKDESITVKQLIEMVINQVKEDIIIEDFVRWTNSSQRIIEV